MTIFDFEARGIQSVVELREWNYHFHVRVEGLSSGVLSRRSRKESEMKKYVITAAQNWYPYHRCDLEGSESDYFREVVEAKNATAALMKVGAGSGTRQVRLGTISVCASEVCEKCRTEKETCECE